MTNIKCCKDCTEIHIGCHSDCDRYNKEKSEIEKNKSMLKYHKEKNYRDRAYVIDTLNKMRRNHR